MEYLALFGAFCAGAFTYGFIKAAFRDWDNRR